VQSFAQTVSVKLNNYKTGLAYLSSLSGEKVIQFDKNKWLDFVNDGEDVSITTDANNILDSLKFIKSESNQFYYAFLKLNKQYKSKSDLLQLMLARYPKNDDYYTTSQNKLTQLQKEYLDFVNIVPQKNDQDINYILSPSSNYS
jgi:hypothetical protein